MHHVGVIFMFGITGLLGLSLGVKVGRRRRPPAIAAGFMLPGVRLATLEDNRYTAVAQLIVDLWIHI